MNLAATVTIGEGVMNRGDVVAVCRDGALVEIADSAWTVMSRSRQSVQRLESSMAPVYGVSTGFGALATRYIDAGLRAQLQRSLIRSHAAGLGPPVEAEVVRALMLLRLKTLATGCTGARPELAAGLAGLLNARITPVVREFGSLGCSGDLVPLAHCALTLIGEGEASDSEGSLAPSEVLLRRAGLQPIVLEAKEGLALINGTDGMLGMLILAAADLHHLLRVADIAAAVSIEALMGTDQVLRPELMAMRPHPGQAASADNIRRLLADSRIVASHRDHDRRVQDAYSLRCAAQVAGAVRDTLDHACSVAERELQSAIDNPVVLDDGGLASNGNFHGAPIGYVLDFLAIAVADLGSISERRTDRLLDPARSAGLPPFLAHDPGVDSGLMMAQYAQAALVLDTKRLAVPASVDSIPSSAMQEDHVSMGWSAGRKLRASLDNLRRILAIELVAGCRALDLRSPLAPSPATAAVRDALRAKVPGPGPDRFLSPELAAAEELIRGDLPERAAADVAGPLH